MEVSKMPKVKVIGYYYDKVRKEYPKLNDEFEVEEKRADFLVKEGVVKVVEAPQKKVTKKD